MRFVQGLNHFIRDSTFLPVQLTELQVSIRYNELLQDTSFIVFDITVMLLSVSALIGLAFGVFVSETVVKFTRQYKENVFATVSKYFLTKKKEHGPINKVTDDTTSNRLNKCMQEPVSLFSTPGPKLSKRASYYTHRKNWRCYPLSIVSEQLRLATHANAVITLTNNIAIELNPRVDVCPSWLGKAIGELFQNSIKHNAHLPDLHIHVVLDMLEHHLILTVEDNGVGISQAITAALGNAAERSRNLIETLYSQLDSPVNLFSLQSLLKQMHGKMELISARNFRTAVVLTLPMSVKQPDNHLNSMHVAQKASPNQSCQQMLASLLPEPVKSNGTQIDPKLGGADIGECLASYQLQIPSAINVNDPEAIKFISKFNRLLAQHYHNEHFNRPAAANFMLMTEKTLARRLRLHYEIGFVEALRQFRLNKARELLGKGAKVTTVAFDTGFSSPSYFTQCFRAEFGFAPSLLFKYSEK